MSSCHVSQNRGHVSRDSQKSQLKPRSETEELKSQSVNVMSTNSESFNVVTGESVGEQVSGEERKEDDEGEDELLQLDDVMEADCVVRPRAHSQ